MLIGKKFGKTVKTINKDKKNSLYTNMEYKGCLNTYLLNISFNAFAGKNFTF